MQVHKGLLIKNRRFLYAFASQAATRRGLSLVEMVVVLLLIGAIMAIMIPLLSGMINAVSTTKQARNMSGHLRNARNIAIGKNREVVFELDLDHDSYRAVCQALDEDEDEHCGIKPISIPLAGVRPMGGSEQMHGIYRIHFQPGGVGEQLVILVGDNSDHPEAIVELNRYLGHARVIVKSEAIDNYRVDSNLVDDSWQHRQED